MHCYCLGKYIKRLRGSDKDVQTFPCPTCSAEFIPSSQAKVSLKCQAIISSTICWKLCRFKKGKSLSLCSHCQGSLRVNCLCVRNFQSLMISGLPIKTIVLYIICGRTKRSWKLNKDAKKALLHETRRQNTRMLLWNMQRTLLHKVRCSKSPETKPFVCRNSRSRTHAKKCITVELWNARREIVWGKGSVKKDLWSDEVS